MLFKDLKRKKTTTKNKNWCSYCTNSSTMKSPIYFDVMAKTNSVSFPSEICCCIFFDTRWQSDDKKWPHNSMGVYKNGSMVISKAEQGMFKSKLLITSGWRTPSWPITWPLAKISAQRPGKKVGSAKTSKSSLLVNLTIWMFKL